MDNSIDKINEDAAKACAKPIPEPAGYSFDNWYEERGHLTAVETRQMNDIFDQFEVDRGNWYFDSGEEMLEQQFIEEVWGGDEHLLGEG